MSYKISVDNIDDIYCSYKSPVITFDANTEYTLFYLPYRADQRFYPEQAVAYFNYKSSTSDNIYISIGWLTTNPSYPYTDWAMNSYIGYSGLGIYQGYFQEFQMNSETFMTGGMYRKAAPGGTRIVAKSGAKTGVSMQLTISIDGYWMGENTYELP